jgi:hypothetical protein
MSNAPWTFAEATQACRRASQAQEQVEENLRQSYSDSAEKEQAYRQALASEIVKNHNDGVAWTAAADLAKGDPHVATLRKQRDVAEGVKEAMQQSAWRRAADRRDASMFAQWSMRAQLADGGEVG